MASEEKYLDYLKRATVDLRHARRQLAELEDRAHEPIAVVGMACRFPGGADTPEALWRLLADGPDPVGPFPTDRGWRLDDLFDDDPTNPRTTYARSGSFLRDAGWFDPDPFDIGEREALAMDPQQRVLLELAWESAERAGIAPTSLRGGDTGVYLGVVAQEYGRGAPEAADVAGHVMTGRTTSIASGRIAYTLGLEGPTATVDTACSSALLALHLAVRALRAGECSLALAGGAAILGQPDMLVEFGTLRGSAPDGVCRPFAEDATGIGWGEGAGMVLVQRLSDALAQGRPVLAVLRGSAVNSDGASNGLTAPHGPAQRRVIQAALDDARLPGTAVDAVEAHGTGTPLGDTIEAHALQATYGRDRDDPLHVGSVKSVLGHTQAASGMAGLLSMVMALREGTLPRTRHTERPTTRVDWRTGALRLLTEPTPWPARDRPRRGAVSSFSFSGTNVHLILEQAPGAPTPPTATTAPTTTVWPVSARTPDGVRAQAARLRDALDTAADVDPHAVAWTLGTGRAALETRAVVLGDDLASLRAGLDVLAAEGTAAPAGAALLVGTQEVEDPAVAVVFTGELPPGQAEDLAARFPVFAASYEELRPAGERIAHQIALFDLVVSAGITPEAVAGAGADEYAAAVAAGLWSRADALHVLTATPDQHRAVLDAVTFHEPDLPAVAERPVSTRDWLDPAYWSDRPGPSTGTAGAVDLAALAGEGTTVHLVLGTSPPATSPGTDIVVSVEDGPLAALARLHTLGRTVDWRRVLPARHPVDLPTYAFQRRHYWLGGGLEPAATAGTTDPTGRPAAPPDADATSGAGGDDSPERAARRAATRDRLAALPSATRERHLVRLVTRTVADALDQPAGGTVPARRSFTDLGVGSLAAVRIRDALAAETGVSLAVSAAFDHPTPRDLARHLLAALFHEDVAEPRPPRRPEAAPATGDTVALVGMACRFPGGSDSPDAYWRLLVEGTDPVTDVPAGRWDAAAYHDPDRAAPGRAYTQRAAYLPDIADWDATLFGYTAREAVRLDPQHRMVLELVWSALEDAGLSADRVRGSRTGVFLGMTDSQQYQARQAEAEGRSLADDPLFALGTSASAAAGRIAYHLDLRGPCLTVDTACSSSLVAVHLAVRSLRAGECDTAIVAASSATLSPEVFVQACKSHMLAEDAHCKVFDAAADGYVIGEGGAAVVLRRSRDVRPEDAPPHAVLRGTATNSDGHTNGLTAPSGAAQRAAITDALADAGLRPGDLDFVEAHGSGTALGDAIEFGVLREVFSRRDDDRPLLVGAAKSNVGHLLVAAGMAGLVKAVLALRARRLPPNQHLTTPSDQVDLDGPVRPATGTHPLPGAPGQPPRAGISSFGWSGTNAHLVLEAAPDPTHHHQDTGHPGPHLLTVSGATHQAARDNAVALADHLDAHPELRLSDVAHTLAAGRAALAHRLAVVASEPTEAVTALRAAATRTTTPTTGDTPHAVEATDDARPELAERLAAWGLGQDASDPDPEVVLSTTGTGEFPLPDASDERGWLDLVGRLWERGIGVDLTPLSRPGARTLRLPTYRFHRVRHWPETTGHADTRPGAPAPGITFHGPTWHRDESPRALAPAEPGTVLVLAHDDALADGLRATGHTPVAVRPGQVLRLDGHPPHELDPGEADHLRQLLSEVDTGTGPLRVVHALGLRPAPDTPTALRDGPHSLVALVQAASAVAPTRPLHLLVASTGAADVLGGETLDPLRALPAGLNRSIRREYPSARVSCVDLDPDATDHARHVHIELSALAAPTPPDTAHAWRRGRRWRAVLDPLTLPAVPTRQVWREGGTYAITGGTGELALALAAQLAPLRPRLALLHRRTLPPADRWDTVLAEHPRGEDARVIGELRALRAAGVEAHPFTADVTDPDAVSAALEEAHERLGPLDGVLHLAGVAGGGLLQHRTRERADAVLAPKIAGTLALAEALRRRPVPLLALFSSAVTAVGGFGETDYAAANAFLDAFALAHDGTGAIADRVVSVAWGPWRRDRWQTEALADAPELRARMLRYRARSGISDAAGLDALTRVVAAGPPHVYALGDTLDGLTAQATGTGPEVEAAAGGVPAERRRPRPTLRTPYLAPRDDTERHIAEVWQDQLGVDRVGVHDPFFELGGTSLVGLSVVAHLSSHFGIEFAPANLFERPTVARFAELVRDPDDHTPEPGTTRAARRGERRRAVAARRRR
ncbi:SDR family NAD(P)-dependent oxidoreductase [Actinoalloteichus caeruleus]|uniref:SDR family NAD(P)-dependent oxidoreductase n=1 Tax=Actinoalloteichus cyanogriseus TaxID=2893586 RepID=UPI003BB97673